MRVDGIVTSVSLNAEQERVAEIRMKDARFPMFTQSIQVLNKDFALGDKVVVDINKYGDHHD